MKISFSVNDKRLLIKAVDNLFNIYSVCITLSDHFVVNYCNKDLSVLANLLQDYQIEENDEYIVLKVEKPIFLSYKLKKEQVSNENISTVLIGKIQEMNEKIDKLSERTSDLEEQLENGVVLPGYGVIEKSRKKLILYRNTENVQKHRLNQIIRPPYFDSFVFRNNNISSMVINDELEFRGDSIKPLKYLKELTHIDFVSLNLEDYSILENCQKLEEILFMDCQVKNIDFMLKIPSLKSIRFSNCKQLEDIQILSKLPNLTCVKLEDCSKIKSYPEFRSGVTFNKW